MTEKRKFYGVTTPDFVKIWTDSESLDEVVRRLNARIDPKRTNDRYTAIRASSRASKLRGEGVLLKKFDAGNKDLNVEELNQLIKKREKPPKEEPANAEQPAS
jgi:hypothetical protein